MKKEKLILFDWGGIVEAFTTGYSCRKAWNDLFMSCGYKKDQEPFSSLSKYRTTAIHTEKEFEKVYAFIKDDFGLDTDYSQFKTNYYEIFDRTDYYEDVRDFELSLRDKCYIGILSNLTIFDKKRLDKQVGLSNYDYLFLSFELACRKPDEEIYSKVQKSIPFDKNDVLFIDDKMVNIEAAKEFGWNAVCLSGLELDKIKIACKEFLNR